MAGSWTRYAARAMADDGRTAGSERADAFDVGLIDDRAEFAEHLSNMRVRAGRTIRSLARALDQPPATIGGYFSGQHLPGVAQIELFKRLLRLIGVEDEAEVGRWVEVLVRVRRRPGPRPASVPVPYRGLASFQEQDAAWFFGREVLTDVVVRRAAELSKDPAAGTTLAVVGPSGAGKSSLLLAGVVPLLRSGKTEFDSTWACTVMCPGAQPLQSLAESLAGLTGERRRRSKRACERTRVIGRRKQRSHGAHCRSRSVRRALHVVQ